LQGLKRTLELSKLKIEKLKQNINGLCLTICPVYKAAPLVAVRGSRKNVKKETNSESGCRTKRRNECGNVKINVLQINLGNLNQSIVFDI
ncbi:hypothetical protein BpHYR1_042780, partial [Brachionus plicatilis]